MPCYKPLQAFHGPGGITFDKNKSFGIPIELPCGRCIGCRLEKSKEWALRCVHEAQMHNHNNCFVTLTYSDANLPEWATLDKSHFPQFLRALRQKTKQKIRFYMCGEYGDKTNRPHYHALLFGYKFPDTYLWNIRRGNRVYRSPLLEETWTHGSSEIGSVTFKSAGYVARYLMKKQNGDRAKTHYAILDPDTGEILGQRVPEYTNMSLKPGIGNAWYKKYKGDLWPQDFCITPDGRKMQVPRYYRDLLDKENKPLGDAMRAARIKTARSNPDNSPERLAEREVCHHLKAKQLKRDFL